MDKGAARTWGQFVTGPFQDAIHEVLARRFTIAEVAPRASLSCQRPARDL